MSTCFKINSVKFGLYVPNVLKVVHIRDITLGTLNSVCYCYTSYEMTDLFL